MTLKNVRSRSVCFKYDFEILGRQGGKKESNIGYRILFLKAEEAI